MLLYCITLSSSRENQRSAQEVARRISGIIAGEIRAKSSQDIPNTHHNSYPSHYIICHLPLVFLSPTSPLPFYSPSLSVPLLFSSSSLFACFLFACVLDCLLVMMALENTNLCEFSNNSNNDFLSTLIAPLTDVESCEINAALLNLVMTIRFPAFLVKMPLPI